MTTTIKINGVNRTVDADDDTPLLWVLSDVLGMTGTKFGCGVALCGACTVHLDGVAIRSCITTIDSIGASAITTVEAIGATPAGARIQKAWLDLQVPQCGTVSRGRSCRLQPLSRAMRIRPMLISMRQCREISVVAAPTSASAKPSSKPPH